MGSLHGDLLYNNGATAVGNLNPLDPDEFRRQGHMVIDFLADYYRDVHKYPVRSQVEPGYLRYPDSAPNAPESMDAILNDVQTYIVPGITHWQSPNCYAYFPSSGAPPASSGRCLAPASMS